jgi:GDP/UDP-N,N'-diacetylbacillosamine 2-epimerase (hydrolysing)
VTGDRVEPFAAAAAAQVSGRVVAHVHGGDRALGQVDDTLRHAITKLAHVHFPATRKSAQRIAKLGEDKWRIHRVGSPGIDGIVSAAAASSEIEKEFGVGRHRFALLVLHPADADNEVEERRARLVLSAVRAVPFEKIVVVYPNNDPGNEGIIRQWDGLKSDAKVVVRRDIPRAQYLGLVRDAAVLVGNSSSGILEAASFRTPVVDIGPRQLGRERGENVTNVPYGKEAIRKALARVWNRGRPRRATAGNIYAGGQTAGKLANVLAGLKLDDRLRRKLISY